MTSDQVCAAFTKANIKYAEIIDDAFNEEPGALTNAAITTFLAAIGEDGLNRVGEALEIASATEDQVIARLETAEGAAKFFEKRQPFGAPADALYGDFVNHATQVQSDLQPLIELLTHCKIEFRKCGVNYEPGERAPDIMFIDLKLTADGADLDIQLPLGVMRKVKNQFDGANPVVFLMSSLNDALANRREEFRRDGQLFMTQFESLRKGDLKTDTTKVERQLIDMAGNKPYIDQVASHAKTWSDALTAAKAELNRVLLDLDIPDYFVLRDTTAEFEGVGLGTYVTDLLLELLSHHTEGVAGLASFIKDLNGWDMKTLPRTRFHPVPAVERVYQANTLSHRSRLDYEKTLGLGVDKGKLRLGDIFFPTVAAGLPTTALVVMTPECDLVRLDGTDHRVNVLLCQGSVKEFSKDPVIRSQAGQSTPIVMKYTPAVGPAVDLVITWNKKLPVMWTWEDVEKLGQAGAAWVHVGRMRPMYALQLQNILTTDLNRVGVQPRPVIQSSHQLTVLIRESDKWVDKYHSDPADLTAAQVTAGRTDVAFVINGGNFEAACTAVETWAKAQPATDSTAKQVLAAIAAPGAWPFLRCVTLSRAEKTGIYVPLTHQDVHLSGDADKGKTHINYVLGTMGSDRGYKNGADATKTESKATVVFAFNPCKSQ